MKKGLTKNKRIKRNLKIKALWDSRQYSLEEIGAKYDLTAAGIKWILDKIKNGDQEGEQ